MVDLTHREVVINDSQNQDMFERPTSRLGFNPNPLISGKEPESSDTGKWARSLFQNVTIPNLPPTKADSRDSTSTVSDSEDEDKSDCSSCDESDDDLEPSGPPRFVSRSQKTSAPLSVSRLSFPFNITTPSPRHRAQPPAPIMLSPPPIPRKYSCLPSPLASEEPAHRPPLNLQNQQRHGYRHHGYSRLALFHTKWFWSMREEAWQTDNAKSFFSNPNQHRCSRSFYIQQQPNDQPPATIYPRRGDIDALRDPYCMHVDQCFATLPTWTIGKTLWMHDVHMLSTKGDTSSELPDIDDESFDESASQISIDTSASAGFSDDSDTTLVESEAEGDRSDDGSSSTGKLSNGKAHTTPEFFLAGKPVWTHNVYLPSSKTSATSSRSFISRSTTWYSRWELLIELSRRERVRARADFNSHRLPLAISLPQLGAFSIEESPPILSFAKAGYNGEGDQIWSGFTETQDDKPAGSVALSLCIHASHPAAG